MFWNLCVNSEKIHPNNTELQACKLDAILVYHNIKYCQVVISHSMTTVPPNLTHRLQNLYFMYK